MTRGKKILVGCLVAVGAMVLTVILAVVLFVSWIRSPGPELEGHRLVDENTTLYAEVRLRKEDTGVRDLIRAFVEGRNRNAVAEIENNAPPFMQKFLPLIQQASGGDMAEEDLDKALPLAVILTSVGTSPGPAPPLFAIDFPASGHTLILMDWVFARASGSGDDDLLVRRYGGEDLFRANPDNPVWFSIVETHVLLSPAEEAVQTGVDRMRRPAATVTDMPLQALMAEAPADAALTLAAHEGGAGTLLALAADHLPALADMLSRQMGSQSRISAWARVESMDRLAGKLLVTDPATAPAAEMPAAELSTYTLELLEGTVRLTLADKGLDASGRRQWDFSLDGLESLVLWAAARASGSGINIRP